MEKQLTPLIIDAHSHLWLKQDTLVDGQPIRTMEGNGSRSLFFGEERQMLPPFMIDGRNTAEVFLSNMDYAQVAAAVVVQEIIDGCQNNYLTEVQRRWPERFFCMGMAQTADEAAQLKAAGLKGIAIPGHRIATPLHDMLPMFKYMEREGMVLSMCLGKDERQIAEMGELIEECPQLKVAIGHFGMVTTSAFEHQVKLALKGENVRIESGGITWLYNAEFYPFPSAVRSIRTAADWVGMDRLMWGSDYPRAITAITYRMSYDFILKTREMSWEEKKAFLGENAKQFYGLNHPIELPYIKNMSE